MKIISFLLILIPVFSYGQLEISTKKYIKIISNDYGHDVMSRAIITFQNKGYIVLKGSSEGLSIDPCMIMNCNVTFRRGITGYTNSVLRLLIEDCKGKILLKSKGTNTTNFNQPHVYNCFIKATRTMPSCINKDKSLIIAEDEKASKEKAIKEYKEYKELLEIGLISQEEFDVKAKGINAVVLGIEKSNTNENISKKEDHSEVFISDVDVKIPVINEINPYRFALVIGNEDYSSKQKSLSNEVDVPYARNDAESFKNYLTSFLGFKEEQVTILKDATSGELNREIEKLVQLGKLDNNSELVFYYAGHGLPEENTKIPYLVPVDVSTINLRQSGISLKELYAKFSSSNASKITVFLDACFSGGGRSEGLLAARGMKIKPQEETTFGNMIVFASSSGSEKSLSYEDEQHGYFTYFLLKKLQETKGVVSYSDLADYIKREVAKKSLIQKNLQQTPCLNISPDIDNRWQDWSFR